MNSKEATKAMRRAERQKRVDALREGRVEQRSVYFQPKAGKGSYRRKGKYGKVEA